ncbi:unnamed protein product [Rhizophagus irregularis]|nr:unnamed protein product [Rhizophagus irregularis]
MVVIFLFFLELLDAILIIDSGRVYIYIKKYNVPGSYRNKSELFQSIQAEQRSGCKLNKDDFDIIGIQIAGTKMHLNILIQENRTL